jgi:hypothetical protein
VLPRSKIRWQASSYKGKNQVLVFVGASLLANGGGQQVLPRSKIRWQASSYKGKSRVLIFVGASLLAIGHKKLLLAPGSP